MEVLCQKMRTLFKQAYRHVTVRTHEGKLQMLDYLDERLENPNPTNFGISDMGLHFVVETLRPFAQAMKEFRELILVYFTMQVQINWCSNMNYSP